MSSIKCIYTPTPCQVLTYIDWNYEPPSHEELMEGSSLTNLGWPRYGKDNGMYGKTISDEQKKAISIANSVPKPYVSKNMKKRHAQGLVYQWNSENNPRSRKIYAEGKEYNTIRECCDAYGFKNHNAIRYRLNHHKWTEWYYL